MTVNELDKEQYEKKIKALQAKIEKVEKEIRDMPKVEDKPKKRSSEEILDSAVRLFRLSSLIAGAKKLPEFKEGLKRIDHELKDKLSTIPLKRTTDNIPLRSRG